MSLGAYINVKNIHIKFPPPPKEVLQVRHATTGTYWLDKYFIFACYKFGEPIKKLKCRPCF